MAKLYVKSGDVNSRLPWLYTLLTKCSAIEIVPFNYADSHHVLMNPTKSLPFLIDEDIRVWGGPAVSLYIAENFSSYSYYSQSLVMKVKYNSILCWIASTFYRSVMENFVLPQTLVECKLNENDNKYLLEYGLQNTKDIMTDLEATYFSKTKNLCGDKEFIGDFYLALILMELENVKFDMASWPKTKVWYEHVKPKIVECLPV